MARLFTLCTALLTVLILSACASSGNNNTRGYGSVYYGYNYYDP